MARPMEVDIALHIVRIGAGVRGTVAVPTRQAEDFDGWLELTAVIARAIDAAEEAGRCDSERDRSVPDDRLRGTS